MQGTITGRDVLLHSLSIVRLWGLPCYLRCLLVLASRRNSTFLEVLSTDCAAFRPNS